MTSIEEEEDPPSSPEWLTKVSERYSLKQKRKQTFFKFLEHVYDKPMSEFIEDLSYEEKLSLLDRCCKNDQYKEAQELIRAGVKVSDTYFDGNTEKSALRRALKNNAVVTVMFLLHREKVDLRKEMNGESLLELVLKTSFNMTVVGQLLLDDDLDLNYLNKEGVTMLSIVYTYSSDRLFPSLLRDKRVQVNLPNSDGERIIHMIASDRDCKNIGFILDRQDLEVTATDDKGRNVLHLLETSLENDQEGRRLSFLQVLLEKRPDDLKAMVNVKDKAGNTPFHYACNRHLSQSKPSIFNAKVYFEIGANPSIRSGPFKYKVEKDAAFLTYHYVSEGEVPLESLMNDPSHCLMWEQTFIKQLTSQTDSLNRLFFRQQCHCVTPPYCRCRASFLNLDTLQRKVWIYRFKVHIITVLKQETDSPCPFQSLPLDLVQDLFEFLFVSHNKKSKRQRIN